jgi:hypothetical protein
MCCPNLTAPATIIFTDVAQVVVLMSQLKTMGMQCPLQFGKLLLPIVTDSKPLFSSMITSMHKNENLIITHLPPLIGNSIRLLTWPGVAHQVRPLLPLLFTTSKIPLELGIPLQSTTVAFISIHLMFFLPFTSSYLSFHYISWYPQLTHSQSQNEQKRW